MFALSVGDCLSTLIAIVFYLCPGLAISKFLTNSPGHLSRALPLTIGVHFLFYEYGHFVSIKQSNLFSVVFIAASLLYLGFGISRESLIRGAEAIKHQLVSIFSGCVLLVIWINSSKSFGSIIPNHDAMNHSYMIRNILETGSQQVEEATRLFPLGAGHAGSFYPLGEHSLIAAAVRLTNSSISGQMNVMVFLLSIALFPYAMTLFCELLFKEHKKIVRIATPISSLLLISTFPLSPISWGGMAVIIAMAYVPGAATMFANSVEENSRKSTFLSALLFIGLFVMHNTEAITAYFLAILIILFHSKFERIRKIFLETCKLGLIAFFAVWPLLPRIIGGAEDRGASYQGVIDSVTVFSDYAVRFFVGAPQFALLLLIVLALMMVPRSVSTTFGSAYVALGAICIIAAQWPSNKFVLIILKPWYGQVLRINYNVVYLVVPLLVALLIVVFRSFSIKSIRTLLLPISFACVFGVSMTKSIEVANEGLSHWYKVLVPNSSSSLAAYEFMKTHAVGTPMAMTENDTTSNSSWMYATAGVQPINATAMTGPGMDKYSTMKAALLANIGQLDNHPEILSWINSMKVQYFYFDENVNPITPNHQTSLEALRSDSALEEVFSYGNAHVFEFRKDQ